MSRASRVSLLLLAILLLMASISSSQSAKPAFSVKDRELIETYYNHLIGTLAPGSLEWSPFSPAIERSFEAGSHVPLQLEKDLEPLPAKLEGQLTLLTGDYRRYTIGRHVVLVRKSDLAISDIIKNVAVKQPK
jgi:hypothetical protein